MRKKATNEDIAKFIADTARQVSSEMDLEFRIARGRMEVAEVELYNTLDERQRKFYKEFCQARSEFYKIASEIYERKF